MNRGREDTVRFMEYFGWNMELKLSHGMLSVDDIKLIVDKMGKVCVNLGGMTLLHNACQHNLVDVVEYLTSINHPLEVKTENGETPLDRAVTLGHTRVTFELLKVGANVDCQTTIGLTPLHKCAFYSHAHLCMLLSVAGATRTIVDFQRGFTPYQIAKRQNNPELAWLLKPTFDENGIDISGDLFRVHNPNHPDFNLENRTKFLELFIRDYDRDDYFSGSDFEEYEEEDEEYD
jgi:hypothetical protein